MSDKWPTLERTGGFFQRNTQTDDVIKLATKYGRYGYRRITALLNSPERGWRVNHKRVERIWRREGLKVPQKQTKRGRLWMNDGSCSRLRPENMDMFGVMTSW